MVNRDVSPANDGNLKLEKLDASAVPTREEGTDEAVEVHRGADRGRAPPGRGGTPPADVCRQLGVSEATFDAWKKKYAHLGVSELQRLRLLEDENTRLKRLVADLCSTSTSCRRP